MSSVSTSKTADNGTLSGKIHAFYFSVEICTSKVICLALVSCERKTVSNQEVYVGEKLWDQYLLN